MIGRLIRIVILGLVLFAAWRVGQAYLDHYKFSDEVDQIAERGVRTTDEQVRTAVADAAARYTIPLDSGQVSIRLQGEHCYIELRYTRQIEVLPRYVYPWKFAVSAHGWEVPSGGFGKKK